MKPENILLIDSNAVNIRKTKRSKDYIFLNNRECKIIDMGGGTYKFENREHLVQTRQYRAVEVVANCRLKYGNGSEGNSLLNESGMGFKFDEKIDIWSVGCIAYELYTNQ